MSHAVQETGKRALALKAATQMRQWFIDTENIHENVSLGGAGSWLSRFKRRTNTWTVQEDGYLRVLYTKSIEGRRGCVIANVSPDGPFLFREVDDVAVDTVLKDYPLLARALGTKANPELIGEISALVRASAPLDHSQLSRGFEGPSLSN